MSEEVYTNPRYAQRDWTPQEVADLLGVDNPGTLQALIRAFEGAGYVLPNLGAGRELHDALLHILGVRGGIEEITGSTDQRSYLDVIDSVGNAGLSATARQTPPRRGRPARPHWYAPDVGLDRTRHPWDPADLVEQLEAAALLDGEP